MCCMISEGTGQGKLMDNEAYNIRKKIEAGLMAGSTENNGKILELNDGNFDQSVSGDKLTLVDFWAPWCAPCRFVSPIVEELGSQYSKSMNTGKLNVDDNPLISSRYRITSIPTLMFFRNGKPVDYVIGALPKNILETKIKTLLGTA